MVFVINVKYVQSTFFQAHQFYMSELNTYLFTIRAWIPACMARSSIWYDANNVIPALNLQAPRSMLCPAAIVWIRLQSQSLGIPYVCHVIPCLHQCQQDNPKHSKGLKPSQPPQLQILRFALALYSSSFVFWCTCRSYPCQMWNVPSFANVYKSLFKRRIINEIFLTGRLGRLGRLGFAKLSFDLTAVCKSPEVWALRPIR